MLVRVGPSAAVWAHSAALSVRSRDLTRPKLLVVLPFSRRLSRVASCQLHRLCFLHPLFDLQDANLLVVSQRQAAPVPVRSQHQPASPPACVDRGGWAAPPPSRPIVCIIGFLALRTLSIKPLLAQIAPPHAISPSPASSPENAAPAFRSWTSGSSPGQG